MKGPPIERPLADWPKATKIRIDAPSDLDDQTCEIGQPYGVIEAPLDRVVGRVCGPSAFVVTVPYTTSHAPSLLLRAKKLSTEASISWRKRPRRSQSPSSRNLQIVATYVAIDRVTREWRTLNY
jgi:hypothetical protein